MDEILTLTGALPCLATAAEESATAKQLAEKILVIGMSALNAKSVTGRRYLGVHSTHSTRL